MAIPGGIQTFTLTFGAAAVLGADEAIGMNITVTASTSAIWVATGQPFLMKKQTATAAIGQSGTITLISPDQDGFANAFGVGVRNWTYAVHLDYVDNTGKVIASADKNFAYRSAMGSTIDLDLTVPVSTSAGVIVDIPVGAGGGTVTDAHIIAVIAAALQGVGVTISSTSSTITITAAATATTFSLLTETGDTLTTESGDVLVTA